MINVAVLGSTGSIGTQVLDVIERNSDKLRAAVLTANSNTDLLLQQYEKFRPDYVGIFDKNGYSTVANAIEKNRLVAGQEALTFASTLANIDVVVVAVSGMIGLYAVDAAIKNNKRIALANKESLVAGGELIKEYCSKIIPIDSEHSAIMQCLLSGRREDVSRLILTASGGPFYGKTTEQLRDVTLAAALRHPTWSMGKKISIDSATMMNKALEIIEARYLFDTTQIDYIIHPESIVHSMVEFCDGSTIAQMGLPSMELPIQYALTLPIRQATSLPRLELSRLTFLPPDEQTFPAPRLAKDCIQKGKDYCCRFNAANEAAVSLFLQQKIGFTDIYKLVEKAVSIHNPTTPKTIAQLFDCYNQTVEEVTRLAIGK